MKNLNKFILFVCIYSISFSQQSGWYYTYPAFTSLGFEDIKKINSTTAYAIGGLSSFMKTTDAGLTWSNGISSSEFTGMTPERIHAIHFINQNTGWAVGYNNAQPPLRIFKTTNAGIFWVRQGLSLGNAYLEDVYFINEFTGWIAANNKIYRTIDSGENWQLIQLPVNNDMYCINFFNSNTGFTSGGNYVYKSTNGGINWISSYYAVNSNFYSIKFLDQNTGFVTGLQYSTQEAKILKTTNGGANWTVKYSMPSGQLNSLEIISPSNLVAVGGSFTYSTEKIVNSTDGGESWNEITSGISNQKVLMTLSFFDQNTGIAAGYDGKLMRTTNKGLNWNETNLQNNRIRSNSIFFNNSMTGIITCENGKLFRTNNGGINWDSISFPSNENLTNGYIYGNYIYVIGSSTFYKSSNNGNTWLQNSLGRYVMASDFTDQNTGFLYGNISGQFWSHNTFFRTTNGGNTWDSSAIQYMPYVMEFINSETGYLAGGNSGVNTYLAKTTNSGISWTKYDFLGTYKKPRSISFMNANTGWVGCDENVLIRTTNGGINYQLLNFNMPQSWTTPKIFFSDDNNGWAAVNNPSGQMLKTTNGGVNWQIQFDCGIASISSFHFIDNNTGWCAGFGFILKTTNGGNFITGLIKNNEMYSNTFSLSQNYPNPFNPVTNIRFDIPKSGYVKIIIHDLLGREITQLVNQQMHPGSYSVDWDAGNYPSGVYFYSIEAGDYKETRKMVLVK